MKRERESNRKAKMWQKDSKEMRRERMNEERKDVERGDKMSGQQRN